MDFEMTCMVWSSARPPPPPHPLQPGGKLPYVQKETLVVSLRGVNIPVPELSLSRALYRGWTQAREERVQDNLHAHAHNEPIRSEECGFSCLGRAR